MAAIKKLLKSIAKVILKDPYVITEDYKKCLEILENSNLNLLITGKAGTGKTTLIQYFRTNSKKKIVVLAPTGIAALNSRGQTIHSFFGFPPRLINLNAINKKSNSRIYKDIDCVVIDEISMVRADLLDGIDKFLRLHGRDKNKPFGGTQMIFVGDLYQLPPVLTDEEAEIYNQLYDSPYFFSANSFRIDDFERIELNTIFRQKELNFIEFLNKVRNGNVSFDDLELINNRLTLKSPNDRYIVLTTTNKTAKSINELKLDAIKNKEYTYRAATEGDFQTEDRNLPVELELKLKKGARVLFVKNHRGGEWVNGTLGVVEKLGEDLIQIKLDETGKIVNVEIEEWDNIEYGPDEKTGNINEIVIGKLKQYPLKLAWAITIHKSQGMSFDKVCLDFSRSPFAHGQTYVALSRCRRLDGILLTKKLWPNDILIDERIIEFYNRI